MSCHPPRHPGTGGRGLLQTSGLGPLGLQPSGQGLEVGGRSRVCAVAGDGDRDAVVGGDAEGRGEPGPVAVMGQGAVTGDEKARPVPFSSGTGGGCGAQLGVDQLGAAEASGAVVVGQRTSSAGVVWIEPSPSCSQRDPAGSHCSLVRLST